LVRPKTPQEEPRQSKSASESAVAEDFESKSESEAPLLSANVLVDLVPPAPCVRIVVASVFHKNITGSGKLDISEALS